MKTKRPTLAELEKRIAELEGENRGLRAALELTTAALRGPDAPAIPLGPSAPAPPPFLPVDPNIRFDPPWPGYPRPYIGDWPPLRGEGVSITCSEAERIGEVRTYNVGRIPGNNAGCAAAPMLGEIWVGQTHPDPSLLASGLVAGGPQRPPSNVYYAGTPTH